MPSSHDQPVTSAQLAELASHVASAASDAVDALAEFEQTPPPPNNDVCSDLEALRGRLQDMIAAVNATMADIGCGA